MSILFLGKKLRFCRENAGFTQEDIAVRLGKTPQAISSFESGRTRVDVETLSYLAQLYHADVNELLGVSSPESRISPEEEALLKKFRDASPQLQSAAMAVLSTDQPPSWQKYVGGRMAARGGGVTEIDEEKAKELDRVARYLRELEEGR